MRGEGLEVLQTVQRNRCEGFHRAHWPEQQALFVPDKPGAIREEMTETQTMIGAHVLVPFPVERPWPQAWDWDNPIYKPGVVVHEFTFPEGGNFGGKVSVHCKVGHDIVGRFAEDVILNPFKK